MQELTGPEFEFALNGFHALTCLDGCRTGNCADQRFGCQFFFGTRRGAHGRYSGRLSGEYSAWLDLKNMSMAGHRSARRWLNGFVTKWFESYTNPCKHHRLSALHLTQCNQTVGVSLLAIAVIQPMIMLAEMAQSRAGSLLQGFALAA